MKPGTHGEVVHCTPLLAGFLLISSAFIQIEGAVNNIDATAV